MSELSKHDWHGDLLTKVRITQEFSYKHFDFFSPSSLFVLYYYVNHFIKAS